MRTFLSGVIVGIALTFAAAIAADLQAADSHQKLVNWNALGQRASALIPPRLAH